MGDALGTYFEARTTYEASTTNLLAGGVTLGGLALARCCWETLVAFGEEALSACEVGFGCTGRAWRGAARQCDALTWKMAIATLPILLPALVPLAGLLLKCLSGVHRHHPLKFCTTTRPAPVLCTGQGGDACPGECGGGQHPALGAGR